MSNKKIVDEHIDFELEELQKEVEFKLENFDVEYPSETEMMMTIDAIRPYVPKKEHKWEVFKENISAILKHAYQEVFYISSTFWFVNSLFLLISIVAVLAMEQNPYAILMILAPIPTLIGLLEILKSKFSGMAELEMSYKFSLQEVILSKMVVIGGFNLFINVLFTLIISLSHESILVWKMMFVWMLPFTIIMAISLMMVNRIRSIYVIAASLVVWIGLGVAVSQSQWIEKIENVPPVFYILSIVIAVSYSVFQLKQFSKRGMTYEFND